MQVRRPEVLADRLETIPGKSWFTVLRMYGPLEPWINKTWRPGEIELVESIDLLVPPR